MSNPQTNNAVNNTEQNTFSVVPAFSQLTQTVAQSIAPTFTQPSGVLYSGELNTSAFNFAGTGTALISHAVATDVRPTFHPSSTTGLLTLLNAYGINVITSVTPGTNSAVTNAYSLVANTPTGAANNYTAVFGVGNNTKVGIGTLTPHQALSVNGGTSYAVTPVTTATYTALNTDNTLEVNFAGAVAITLPAPSLLNAGQTFVIKDASGLAQTNPITITPASGSIDGASSAIINANYGFLKVYSNGVNYFIIDALAAALPPPTSTWVNVSGTSQTLAVNTGYYTTNPAATTLTLPTTAAAGSIINVTGVGTGLFTIVQGAGQQIRLGTATTTIGPTGTLGATNQGDTVVLLCTTANLNFQVLDAIGNLLIV